MVWDRVEPLVRCRWILTGFGWMIESFLSRRRGGTGWLGLTVGWMGERGFFDGSTGARWDLQWCVFALVPVMEWPKLELWWGARRVFIIGLKRRLDCRLVRTNFSSGARATICRRN